MNPFYIIVHEIVVTMAEEDNNFFERIETKMAIYVNCVMCNKDVLL